MKRRVIASLAVLVSSSVIALGFEGHNLHASDSTDVLPAAGAALALEEGAAPEDTYVDDEDGTIVSKPSTNGVQSVNSVSVASTTESDNSLVLDTIGTSTVNVADIVADPIGDGADMAFLNNGNLEAAAKAQEEKDPENFSHLVIAQVTNYVNVRDIPSETGEVVGKLYDNSVGDFIEEENGWYKITSGHVTGYVKAEYCVTGDEAIELAKKVGTRLATVNTTTLKVRTEASTDAQVLGLVPIEEDLVVLEELDGWVKVSIEEGEGYVSSDYVTLSTDFVKAESKAEEEARLEAERKAQREAQEAYAAAKAKSKTSTSSETASSSKTYNAPSFSDSSMGNSVANYACQFVGNPYVYGGSSLTNGTDCSGFVMSVYSAYGVSLPHSSKADRSVGYEVEGGLANAQPGDIVCYSGHVAIYIGNGQIVHASTAKTGIIISNASYKSTLAVRRIF